MNGWESNAALVVFWYILVSDIAHQQSIVGIKVPTKLWHLFITIWFRCRQQIVNILTFDLSNDFTHCIIFKLNIMFLIVPYFCFYVQMYIWLKISRTLGHKHTLHWMVVDCYVNRKSGKETKRTKSQTVAFWKKIIIMVVDSFLLIMIKR